MPGMTLEQAVAQARAAGYAARLWKLPYDATCYGCPPAVHCSICETYRREYEGATVTA